VDIGLTEIQCERSDGSGTTRRRGALLDSGTSNPGFEIVLTAAHGLAAETDEVVRSCALSVDQEGSQPVVAIWRPDRMGRGYQDDWAVFLIGGNLMGEVSRLPLAPIERPDLQRLLSYDTKVRLPLRFAPTERPCELTQARLTADEVSSGLLAHNCQAWAGHSGSPILIELDGDPYVLGLHLGSRWIFETSEPLRLGRHVDETIANAVEAATEHGLRIEPVSESSAGWLERLFAR
jgi:hypothetical protein